MSYKEHHQDFVLNSRSRWRQLVQGLPDDDPARLRAGYGEIAVSIICLNEPISMDTLGLAFANRPRGWGAFSVEDWYYPDNRREEVERWRGDPDKFSIIRRIARHDYGRIRFDGRLYVRRGLHDEFYNHEPGTVFDVTVPICDIGSMLLYAADLADLTGENHDIAVSYSFTGLSGRRLDMSRGFIRLGEFVSEADVYCAPVCVLSTRQIRADLRPRLHELMAPLYAEFNQYPLAQGVVNHYVHQEILGNYPDGRYL